jgi:hypothetical protein
VKPHNPKPLARDDLAQAYADAQEFSRWLDQLCSHDQRFAQASVLYPDEHTEWQSAVYLVTGNYDIWTSLGPHVLADVSIAPIVLELEHPHRGWSSGERMLMNWAAHLWNIDDRQVVYPYQFDHHHFSRWITACHIRERLTPSMTDPREAQQ